MKLMIVIIQDDDSNDLLDALRDEKIGVTKLSSTGGFLRAGNTTLMIGIDEDRVDEALDIIKGSCSEREIMSPIPQIIDESAMVMETVKIKIGGATVFVLDVEKFIKL